MKRFLSRLALFGAAFALVPLASAANTAPVEVQGTPTPNDASQIEMTNVFAFTAVAINPWASSMTYPVECVWFINKSPVTATHVRFHFVYTSANEKNAGQIEGDDYLDSRGKFSTGIAQEMLPLRQAPVPGKQCRDLPGYIKGKTMVYDKTRDVVTLSAYVSDVDYADGTSWHAPSPAPSPTPTPAPSSSP